jgi:AraC-like DNA-binding protein
MSHQFFTDMGESPYAEYSDWPHVMNYLHLHPQYEVYFCPRAIEQHLMINGREYRRNTPCVVISPPFFIHSMSPVNHETFMRMVFYFSERVLDKFREQYLPGRPINSECLMISLTEAQASSLVPLGDLIAKEGAEKLTAEEKELAMVLFLSHLFHICSEENIETVGKFNLYIQNVFRYISENFMNNISSESVAKEFSVSRSKLDRDLRAYTGCTLHEFLDLCRLNKAKELLSEKQRRSVEEIAIACGFRNESYFYTFFRKHEGVSPLEYRKQYQPQ